ncbi:long-chain-fatty-acid--CoA ligase [Desulfatibacillum aliphaticivorans]|uniref:long-chain-fatty-acid--CoA ligase n=1 Tax=Desulfatibacillum aliphaticivorans TaxID=218208 RepID=UPI00042387C6|nr:long-chain-fatty-acid--CoA ligase [Desulfatibacillum aliphaticivorans]
MQINIGSFLTKRAQHSPNMEALVIGGLRFTYKELNERSNRLANAMKSAGIGPGDRVAYLGLNETEFFDLYFGLGKLGAILVPVNFRLAPPEVLYIINNCEASKVVVGTDFFPVIDAIKGDLCTNSIYALGDSIPEWAQSYSDFLASGSPDEPVHVGGDDDTLTILYTSGTTGKPKGAELTHAGYFHEAVNLRATLGDVGTKMLMPLPLFHIGALAPVPHCVQFGMTMVFQRAFDPAEFLQLLATENISWFGSVPQVLMFLRSVPQFETFDWSSIRMALVYAAPVPVTLIKEFAEKGMNVRQLYGMTECTGPAAVIDADKAIVKAGSTGPAMFHCDIKLVDDKGEEVPTGELGELLLLTTHPMKGYWNNPEATASTIIDGWIHSGDMAKMDEDGYLYILDRKKDMIISGGENIYPAEVEDTLLSHPAIADVGVIGVQDEKWGEAVKAVIVLNKEQSLTQDELIEWCRDKLARFKTPKQVVFAEEIPRTPTGKILKRILRDQYNQ